MCLFWGKVGGGGGGLTSEKALLSRSDVNQGEGLTTDALPTPSSLLLLPPPALVLIVFHTFSPSVFRSGVVFLHLHISFKHQGCP